MTDGGWVGRPVNQQDTEKQRHSIGRQDAKLVMARETGERRGKKKDEVK